MHNEVKRLAKQADKIKRLEIELYLLRLFTHDEYVLDQVTNFLRSRGLANYTIEKDPFKKES